MKIAVVVCTFPPYKGGMGNSAWRLAEVMAKLGHNITVFTSKQKVGLAEVSNNVKVVRLPTAIKIGNAAKLIGLETALIGFDIIHFHYPFYGSHRAILRAAKRSPQTKLLLHYHMEPAAGGLKGWLFKLERLFILPVLINRATTVITATSDYRDQTVLARYYQKDPDKFAVIPFGVDTDVFVPKSTNENHIKLIRLLFVGGLDSAHYFKGVNILLLAVSQAKNELASKDIFLHLTIIGSGNLLPQYQVLVNTLNLVNEVTFASSVETGELPKYYQTADVFILPSINQGEAFGLVLLEAMASGVAVIASSLPGVRQVFVNEQEGLYVTPSQPNALALAIERLATDRELCTRLGQSGRNTAVTKYNWHAIANQWQKLYKSTDENLRN
ncbi:MAG: glycosyltransferase family 4 protein [Candidatus Falkowbacteria bacterium]